MIKPQLSTFAHSLPETCLNIHLLYLHVLTGLSISVMAPRRCLRISIVRQCNRHCRPVSSCPATADHIPSLHCQNTKSSQSIVDPQLVLSHYAKSTSHADPPLQLPCCGISLHNNPRGNSHGVNGKRVHKKCCLTKQMSKKTLVVSASTCFGIQTDITFNEGRETQFTATTCSGIQKTSHHMSDNIQRNSRQGWENFPRGEHWWLLEGTISTVPMASWQVWLRSGVHLRS